MVGPSGAAADSTFVVSDSVRLCNALPSPFPSAGTPDPDLSGNPACTDNLTPGAPADVTLIKSISGTSSPAAMITFAPAGTAVTPSATLGAGAKAGGAQVMQKFGFVNGPCTSLMTIDFVLYNIPLSPLAYPRPQGQFNRFGHWGPVASTSSVDNMVSDGAGHALPTSPMFQGYPDFLNTEFGGVMPTALYGGATYAGNEWRIMFVAQFGAGALSTLPGAYSKMSSAMGLPAVTFLEDPTATLASASGTTDVCGPVSMTTGLLGIAPGAGVRAASPATAGTHFTLTYNASRRDLDQDGVDNANDSCPTQVNTGDTDGDALDNVCDPFPASGSAGLDEDGDGFVNALDNCPVATNGTTSQVDGEASAAADLGPVRDQVGDACDSGGPIAVSQNARTVNITLSSSVSNGRYLLKAYLIPKCLGGTDADGDGYCSTQDNVDSGACAPNCAVQHSAWSGATHPGLQMDSEDDWYSDVMETYIGTDATKSCAQSSSVNNEAPLDNWPMDGNDSGSANTLDVGAMLPLNLTVNVHPKGTRWDLNNNGIINTLDVGRFVPVLNHACGNVGLPGGQTSPPIPPFSQQ